MQFNSYIFILVFVPLLLIGYFGFNKINIFLGKLYLIAASALFYIYGGFGIAVILAVSIIVNYILALLIDKQNTEIYRKLFLVISIVGNVIALLYFKYYNFFISNANSILKTNFNTKNIILPLGVSFFTFQQIMYLVNIYKREIERVDIFDYLAYILYFPKLVSGPVVEPAELISQINCIEGKRINWDNISFGIKIFCLGFFKKLILADTFAAAVSWGYANMDVVTSMDLFLVMLSYTFEIYFDFSGYSDMAVGISTMLNITLPINFNSPYKALSIREFWTRWHMTLTGFLTKYIYIPLGGSRNGKFRTYVNILIVFLVSGIWHGANWTFVLWGIAHGLFSIADRVLEKTQKKIFEPVRWMCTFFVVNILWLLFRSSSVDQWIIILRMMFRFGDTSISYGLINAFVLPETNFINRFLHIRSIYEKIRGFNLLLFMAAGSIICLVPENNYKNLTKNNWLYMFICAAAFLWGFLCLSSESVFVYFNF